MKTMNYEWIKDTNVTEDDLICPEEGCNGMLEIYHCSPANKVFYAACNKCGRDINVPFNELAT